MPPPAKLFKIATPDTRRQLVASLQTMFKGDPTERSAELANLAALIRKLKLARSTVKDPSGLMGEGTQNALMKMAAQMGVVPANQREGAIPTQALLKALSQNISASKRAGRMGVLNDATQNAAANSPSKQIEALILRRLMNVNGELISREMKGNPNPLDPSLLEKITKATTEGQRIRSSREDDIRRMRKALLAAKQDKAPPALLAPGQEMSWRDLELYSQLASLHQRVSKLLDLGDPENF